MPLSDAKLIACLALNLLHFPHLDAIICLTNYRPEVFQLGPSPLYAGEIRKQRFHTENTSNVFRTLC